MSLIALTPKRTVVGLNHVMCTKREYRRRGSSWTLNRGKKGHYSKKFTKGLYFNYLGRSPHWSDLHQNCVIGDVLDVITCAKFQKKFQVCFEFTGVEFFLIFEWALQECSATALPMILYWANFIMYKHMASLRSRCRHYIFALWFLLSSSSSFFSSSPNLSRRRLDVYHTSTHGSTHGSPFPQTDIIGAMVIVWRLRGKIFGSILCNILRNNCAQCNAHVWTDLKVLWNGCCLTGPISLCLDSFLYMYYCMHV